MKVDRLLPYDSSLSLRLLSVLDRITQISLANENMEDVLGGVLELVLDVFDAERAWFLYPSDPEAKSWGVPIERTRTKWPGLATLGNEVLMTPDISEIFAELHRVKTPIQYGAHTDHPVPQFVIEHFSVKSQLLISLRPKVGKAWVFGLHHCDREIVHDEEDLHLFTAIAHRISDTLSVLISTRQLRESEERFRNLADQAPALIWMADTNNLGTWYNSRWLEYTGRTIEQELGFGWIEGMHPDDRQRCATFCQTKFEGKQKFDMEFRLRRADGSYGWVADTGTPRFDESGVFLGYIGYCWDITERKAAENTLAESEERFRLIMETIDEVFWMADVPIERMLYISPGYERVWGRTRQSLYDDPRSFIEAIHPEDTQRVLADLDAQKIGQPFDHEYRIIRPDGSIRWVWDRGFPIRDKTGEVVRYAGVVQDITGHKRASDLMHKSAEEIKDLYNNAPCGYHSLDKDGVFLQINDTELAWLGYTRDEMVMKMKWSDVITSASQQTFLKSFPRLRAEGFVCDLEFELIRKDGTTFVGLVNATSVCDASEAFVMTRSTVIDITGRKQVEQQLHNLAAHLQSVREEEKIAISREIHDELGSTLTAMKIEAHWLKNELSASREAVALLDHVESMSQLIDSATFTMRNIITGLRPTLLDDLGLLAALEWQATQFHKRTGIKCLVNCIGDKGDLDKQHSIALFRISQEALTNVLRHSGATLVEIEFHHSDEEVVMSIIDNGRGMPEIHTEAAITYGIHGIRERVDQLGGKIRFDIPPGGGLNMTVILRLPANSAGKS